MECRVLGLLKKAVAAKGRVGVAFGRDLVAVAVVRRETGGRAGARALRDTCHSTAPRRPDAGSHALQALGLPKLPASTVLRSEEYQLALVEAPDVPPAEMRAAMRWRLRDAIDFRVEDAVIDVIDVPSQGRGGQSRMLYAVAARRTAVDRHAALLSGVAPSTSSTCRSCACATSPPWCRARTAASPCCTSARPPPRSCWCAAAPSTSRGRWTCRPRCATT